jgi:exopolysaccharide biosynthesis protein
MEIRTNQQPDTGSISRRTKPRARARKRSGWKKFMAIGGISTVVLGLIFTLWFFLTASGTELRYMMADTLITTQHRHWAKYLIGQDGLDQRVQETLNRFEEWTVTEATHEITPPPPEEKKKELVEVRPISGEKWRGYLLTVNDPKAIRIAVPEKVGKGEKVSSMVKRTGAIAGVNAGGFVDPEWKGNGFQPTGLVISGGKIIYNDGASDTPVSIVGIDKDGKMVAGKYKPSELLKMGVSEAVTFSPKFINDGKGLVKNHADGWGIAPRTSMAQKADGTIMFAIIDGRQPHSIGATLYDIQNVFLEEGAVIAANLDGGSSTVLVHNNEIVNKPASPYGERYLPTAFLVFDNPQDVVIKNIWEGIDMTKFDSSKW